MDLPKQARGSTRGLRRDGTESSPSSNGDRLPDRRGESGKQAAKKTRKKTTTKPAKKAGKSKKTRDDGSGKSKAKKPAKVTSAQRDGADRAKESGKYVYCVIRADKALKFGAIGIGAEAAEVHTVNYKDIAAVVSDTPIEVYDPTRENVLTHQHVNETVMSGYTVIPMSFGTVFKTADDIVELLRSAYDAFQDVLTKMENKVEFGLKVLWDLDVVTGLIEQEDEGVRKLREEISSKKGSTYFARMQYGRLIDGCLTERSERYVKEIFEALRDVSVASRANKPIGERMIMNAAFLVELSREKEFDARLKSVGKRFSDLTFRYTGPWPPYNFVNIRLKLERVEETP